jgi:hypothetical protein
MIESKEAGVDGAIEANEYVSLSVEESDLPSGAGFDLAANPNTISWRMASPSKGWKHIVSKWGFKMIERHVPWQVAVSLRVLLSPSAAACRYQGDLRPSQGMQERHL